MIVDCAHYVDGRRIGGRLDAKGIEDALVADAGGFVWLGLHEPPQAEFDRFAEVFGLHPVAVEDAVLAHQRPKLEIHDGVTFVVLKTATYLEAPEIVDFGEIQVFLGDRFVLVVRHGTPAPLTHTRRQLEEMPELLRLGPAAVLHAVVDRVVDEYEPVLAGLEDDIGQVEFAVFGRPESADAERIYLLKREVLGMERAARPLVSVMEKLVTTDVPHVIPEVRPYLRDVLDNVLRVQESLETDRDLLTSILGANLTQITIRQNEDMRKISAWVAIAAVPTMLAGIWGMNFEHMPELDSTVGYPLALALMAVLVTVLWRGFRKAGWL